MTKKIIVIGAGPGGYVCAIRAAQLGADVTVIDVNKRHGGTCLNVGCIPSKNLLQASYEYYKVNHSLSKFGISVERLSMDIYQLQKQKSQILNELGQGIEFLFKKNFIRFIQEKAEISGLNQVKAGKELLNADAIIIASGSTPRTIPNLSIDETVVLSSAGALDLNHVPNTLVVVGAGYIGLELGVVWSRLGSKVHIVEAADRIAPGLDSDLSQALYASLQKQGIIFHLGIKIKAFNKNKTRAEMVLEKDGKTENLSADKILVSIGRVPYTDGLNLEKMNIKKTPEGYIKVNEWGETSVNDIYAIGDVTEGPMLAHKAEEEGIAVAEHIMGLSSHVDYNVIPAVIYTKPEVASVGFSEHQLQESQVPYKASKFLFSANSREKATHDTEGFVKLLSHQETGLVLGAHIIGSHAGTMIAQVAQAMQLRANVEDIARTCCAHPTHSEAIKEAAWNGFANAIHS
ncbi:MAG: dihydrolipoyl dehydrogenase [Pseudomonadota bacterium]|jgi:dihydrolipoamide dehydrogenase|nr:dihydrolipoyl dehydrogenase [Alphaproteobacteria bacterium]